MGSIILFLFSLSILIFQVSCSKTTAQQNQPNAVTQLNKIVFNQQGGTGSGFYIMNYDGTSRTAINITLPVGYTRTLPNAPVMSPDGTKLFIVATYTGGDYSRSIFSCDINGSNVVQIANCVGSAEVELGGAY